MHEEQYMTARLNSANSRFGPGH